MCGFSVSNKIKYNTVQSDCTHVTPTLSGDTQLNEQPNTCKQHQHCFICMFYWEHKVMEVVTNLCFKVLRLLTEGVERVSLKTGPGIEGVSAIVAFSSHHAASMAKKALVEGMWSPAGGGRSHPPQRPVSLPTECVYASADGVSSQRAASALCWVAGAFLG